MFVIPCPVYSSPTLGGVQGFGNMICVGDLFYTMCVQYLMGIWLIISRLEWIHICYIISTPQLNPSLRICMVIILSLVVCDCTTLRWPWPGYLIRILGLTSVLVKHHESYYFSISIYLCSSFFIACCSINLTREKQSFDFLRHKWPRALMSWQEIILHSISGPHHCAIFKSW